MTFTPARLVCVAAISGMALTATQLAAAQPQSAPMGSLEASIDGAPYTGETLKTPSEGTSTAAFRAYGPVVNLSLQAHDPQAESLMHNVLSLEISLMGNDASASVIESSASYWPEGMGKPFYTSDEGGGETQITFEALSLDGDDAKASGSFTTTACLKKGYLEEIDMTDCLPIEGRFDTALRQVD